MRFSRYREKLIALAKLETTKLLQYVQEMKLTGSLEVPNLDGRAKMDPLGSGGRRALAANVTVRDLINIADKIRGFLIDVQEQEILAERTLTNAVLTPRGHAAISEQHLSFR